MGPKDEAVRPFEGPNGGPTRTKGTEAKYLKVVQSLNKAFNRETGKYGERDPEGFVEWALTQRPNYQVSSWRLYRSAITWWLNLQDPEEVPGVHQALLRIQQAGTEPCKQQKRKRGRPKAGNTPATNEKKLSGETQEAINRFLDTRRGQWDRAAKIWLEATRLTGLRPKEWRTALLQEEVNAQGETEPVLKVENAKTTNGRSHGTHRTLYLGQVRPEEMEVIREHLKNAQAWAMAWGRFYDNCSQALGTATRRLWPRREARTSLYSGRHQFSADAKAAGLSEVEIGALMGHATDLTGTKHYGRKQAGRAANFRVQPKQEEVERVKEVARAARARPSQATRGDLGDG